MFRPFFHTAFDFAMPDNGFASFGQTRRLQDQVGDLLRV